MPVRVVQIYPDANLIELDGVTFCINFQTDARIAMNSHPHGPVFECGAAKAILTAADAQRLIAAGVPAV